MLSSKTKYGLHAVFFLADKMGQGPIQISAIAEGEALPRKFLEQILLDLRKKGFLESRKGPGGGYTLAKDPRDISLGSLIRALEGPIALTPCVSIMAPGKCQECRDPEGCPIRLAMQNIRDSTASYLDQLTVAEAMEAGKLVGSGTKREHMYFI